jgi:hypothetical protein
MSSTVSHHSQVSRRAPFLASAAVLGVIAVGAIAVVTVDQNAGGASPSAPDPPAVSYPGSSVFDNQPTGLSRPGE